MNVSEENALKGLPMLLDGAAATWWQGSKAAVRSWQEAVEALRRSFGEQKPNYRIFRELFSTEQREREPTDVFVSHARALLSKLSATPVLDDMYIRLIWSMVCSTSQLGRQYQEIRLVLLSSSSARPGRSKM